MNVVCSVIEVITTLTCKILHVHVQILTYTQVKINVCLSHFNEERQFDVISKQSKKKEDEL